MTEKIKGAIEQLELARNTRIFFPKDISMALAIRSLQAWEEVLQELEALKEDNDTLYIHIRLNNAIDIINKKLAEIEE